MHKSEKKFLLTGDIKSLIRDLKSKVVEYHIFFSKIKLCKEVQYQKRDNKYSKTIRSGVGYAQSKKVVSINKKKFLAARKKRIAKELAIKKYKITINDCELSISAYFADLSGLYILTIPKKCYNKSATIIQNEIIRPYIDNEITNDPRYENKHLALLGDPLKHPYNIYAVFKDIENSRIKSIQKILFKEMKTAQSVRIMLYYLLKEIEKSIHALIQDANNEKELKSYRKNIKLSKFILSEYMNIFEEKLYHKIFLHLNNLLKLTKTQKDLLLIHKKFQKINKKLNSKYLELLLQNLSKKIAEENIKISKYFKTREYAIIHRQYELFIKENNKSYLSYDAQISIGYSATIKFKSTFEKLKHMCSKYDSCNDDKSYEKMEKAFFRFEQFIYSFEEVIEIKSVSIIHKHSKRLFKMLRKCHKLSKTFMIIKMLENQNDQISKPEKEMLKKIKSDFLKKKKILDEKIAKELQDFAALEIKESSEKF